MKMPRGTKLSVDEIKVIENLKKEHYSIAKIARALGRSRCVVYHYLKNSKNYGRKKDILRYDPTNGMN